MESTTRILSNPHHIFPKLLTLLSAPGVVALEDRNNELLFTVQKASHSSVLDKSRRFFEHMYESYRGDGASVFTEAA
jgi:hypothetical protein